MAGVMLSVLMCAPPTLCKTDKSFYHFFSPLFITVINIGETRLTTQENGIMSVIDDSISDR